MSDLGSTPHPQSELRVLAADDNIVFRAGLRALLEKEPDLVVVGEAGTGEEAVACAKAIRPDVVVMDLAMPGIGGIEATRRIAARGGDTKVLVLTGLPEEHQLLAALEAGARGFVNKTSPLDDVARAIRTVMQGRLSLGAEAARFVALQRYLREQRAGDGGGATRWTHRTAEPATQRRTRRHPKQDGTGRDGTR